MRGGRGDAAILDYVMSEKYGLDWKKYDYERMSLLAYILTEENKERALANKKANQQRTRKR